MRRTALSPHIPGAIAAALLAACSGADGTAGVGGPCYDSQGQAFEPCRAFRGRLQLPPAKQLHLESVAFQIAAVGFKAAGAPSSGDAGTTTGDGGAKGTTDKATPLLFFGPIFSQAAGGGERPSVPFSIVVPCTVSLNLLLQSPRSSEGEVPGTMIAAMAFAPEDGSSTTVTLVPQQPKDLCGDKASSFDLDQVALVLKQPGILSSGSITLGKEKSKSPLALIDSDGDGTTDLSDTDDDDDGTADLTDLDADGDKIKDSVETLTALGDADKDGVPDLFQ